MTANQIKFAEHRENKRKNLANEALTASAQQETRRHNVASEDVNWFTAQNVDKYNTILGSVAQTKAREEKRHNLATEKETNRANLEREADVDFQNVTKAIDTGINLGSSVVRGVSDLMRGTGGIISLFG